MLINYYVEANMSNKYWFRDSLREYLPENLKEFSLYTEGDWDQAINLDNVDFKFKDKLELIHLPLSQGYSPNMHLEKYNKLKSLILSGIIYTINSTSLRDFGVYNWNCEDFLGCQGITRLELLTTLGVVHFEDLKNLKSLALGDLHQLPGIINSLKICGTRLMTLELPIDDYTGKGD